MYTFRGATDRIKLERQLIRDYRSLLRQGKEYIIQTMYMAKNTSYNNL